MKISTPLSSAEIQLQAMGSIWSRIFTLILVDWIGCNIGYWIIAKEFDVFAGNPLHWFGVHLYAFSHIWGLIFIILHAIILFVWVFTDSLRMPTLATAFFASGLVAGIVEHSW